MLVFLAGAAQAQSNRPPVASVGGPYQAQKIGATTSVTLAGATASDPDGDPLTYQWSTDAPGAMFSNPAALNPTLTFNATAPAGAVYTLMLMVSDGAAMVHAMGMLLLVDPPTTSAPVGVADEYLIDQNAFVSPAAAQGVLANDSAAGGGPLTAVLVGDAGHGALTLNPDGAFSYSPDPGYTGTDQFTYRASNGSLASEVTTVNLQVDDVASKWNRVALNMVAKKMLMPPQASRLLAMMHAAAFDAANAIDRRFEAYQVTPPNADPGASAVAAVASAAFEALAQLYPDQAAALADHLAVSLVAVPEGAGKTAGLAIGEAVAGAIVAARANDGSSDMVSYTPGTGPGVWRPTPPAFAPAVFTHWRYVTPFGLSSAGQFRPAPPSIETAQYQADLAQVRELGARNSATRTAMQTMIAQFWVGMMGTITEVGQMNRAAEQVVRTRSLSLVERARMYALLNICQADAAIAAMDCKYTYNFWRPITAIREGAINPDPAWESLLAAPAHPEYVSAHSTLTGAGAKALELAFHTDQASFALQSFMDPNQSRTYASFSSVSDEAGMSRIYGGIHFLTSHLAGQNLGRQIAQYVAATRMRPLPPAITLSAPAAGVSIQQGTQQVIQWSSLNLADNVKAFVSVNGGPWITIAWNIANTGSFNWIVNQGPGANCKIRVTSMAGNAVFGESGPFTITPAAAPPMITVSAPAAGADWRKGTQQVVQWHAQNLAGNVKAFVSLDGGPWLSIAWDIPNTGSFAWTVNQGPAANCRIRVTSMNGNLVYGESGAFTISAAAAPPSITVSSPSAGASLARNASHVIRWDSANLAGNVKIFVSLDGGPWTAIAWNIPNTSAFNWMIRQGPATGCRIRVTSMGDNMVYGESGLFAITP